MANNPCRYAQIAGLDDCLDPSGNACQRAALTKTIALLDQALTLGVGVIEVCKRVKPDLDATPTVAFVADVDRVLAAWRS